VRWRALAEEFSRCRDGATVGSRLRLRLAWLSSRIHAMCPALQTKHCVELRTVVSGCTLHVPIRLASDDWYAFIEVFHNREYEVPLQPRTILDVGANVGYASLYFAASYAGARLAAVEPCPGNVRHMRRVLERNRIKANIIEGAAAAHGGDATLYLRGSTSHSLLAEHQIACRSTLKVRAWSIPELLDQCSWDTVDLLKLDVEGYERILLKHENGWLSRVGAIIGELHDSDGAEGMDFLLRPFGFQTSQVVKRGARLFLAVRKGSLFS
jgi:FkbM family methyltransferase